MIPPVSVQKAQLSAAMTDLVEGYNRNWMWSRLALQDIKLRYRGSVLGPFWVTLSTLVLIVALGYIYPRILAIRRTDYVPYLSIGLVTWSFISSCLTEGCGTFMSATQVVQQIRLPLSFHVFHTVCRNVITFAHSFVLLPIVVLIFNVPITWNILWTIPGLALLVINAFWLSLLLGMISSRFRDIPPIVGNFVTIAFFVTPVFWSAHSLTPAEQWIVKLNPFFCALDVVRSPMLGKPPSLLSWYMLLAVTMLGSAATLVLFARLRSRIVFWV